jgi:hypothetical protein
MKSFEASSVINASPDRIWAILSFATFAAGLKLRAEQPGP